ncbi:K02A2.6-like, partial [Cordylochernes scorpioides]
MADDCEFENIKDSLIRDRIVLGCRDTTLREKYLQNPDLTLSLAINQGQEDEASQKQLRNIEKDSIDAIRKNFNERYKPTTSLKNSYTSNPVRANFNKSIRCSKCNMAHDFGKCPAYGKECYKCRQPNHFANCCKNRAVRCIQEIEEEKDTLLIIDSIMVGQVLRKPCKELIYIQGHPVDIKLDTGADVNILPERLIKEWPNMPLLETADCKIYTYTGQQIPVVGKFQLDCKTKYACRKVTFLIVNNSAVPILGLDECVKLNLVKRVETISDISVTLTGLLDEYKDVFKGNGHLSYMYDIKISDKAEPKISPARRLPRALLQPVKEELFKMEEDGIIEKIEEPTVWAHPMALVLDLARESRLKLTLNKLQMATGVVKFLGHTISKEGILPDQDKVRAIQYMQIPKNKQELQRILGTVTYLAKFIPDLSSNTSNMRNLLKKDIIWNWNIAADQELNFIKTLLTSPPVLRHFDPNEPLELFADASKDGLGAILMQKEKPLSYASASLTSPQKHYSPIEKELLALYFGCKRFHYFLYGRKFTAYTDHKPLVSLLKKNFDQMSPRLQRLSLYLLNYQFELKFIPGKSMVPADTLSRHFLPQEQMEDKELDLCSQTFVLNVEIKDQRLTRLQEDTLNDKECCLLKQYILTGWPLHKKNLPSNLKPYWEFKEELHEWQNLICRGNKLLIPKTQRNDILKILHASHQGINNTIALAKGYIYWPGMNKEIEELINYCSICQQTSRANLKEPMLPHQAPEYPWQKSNGMVERTVQPLKKLIKRCGEESTDPYLALFNLRNTPHNNLPSPAQIMKSRKLRSIIPSKTSQFVPSMINNEAIQKQLVDNQVKMKNYYDRHTRPADPLSINDRVWFRKDKRWIPGQLKNQANEPRSFYVKDQEGNEYRRNSIHIREDKRNETTHTDWERPLELNQEQADLQDLEESPSCAYIFWTTLFSWIPGERDHHRTPRELYQCNEMNLNMPNSASPGSSGSAGEEPGRPSIPPPTGVKNSKKNGIQKRISKEISENRDHVNPPAGVRDVNLAAARDDVTLSLPAGSSSNGAARVLGNWADCIEDSGPGADNDFTVVKTRKRRRESSNSPTAAAPSSNIGGARSSRRTQSSARSVPRAQEIPTTRAHIAEARARQASSAEKHCVYLEHGPELQPFHYLRALDRLLGGTAGVIQVSKVNGHQLLGLANRGLAERLINNGLEVEGTLLRAFPFRKRAERITVGNLPFFVEDSAIIKALEPYGRITSIAPKMMKAGPYTYTDGRREAFIVLHEGVTTERLPTRLNITIKGEAWPAYLSSGIKCSRCQGQGHRRANCPLLAGRTTAPGPATPTSPTSVPPATAPRLPQQPSAQPPPPASPSPTMEVSDVPPTSRAALHPPAALRQPQPAPSALPAEDAPPAPPPVTPAPSLRTPGSREPAAPTPDVEMSIVEETSASFTSTAKNATRIDLDAFIERHPSVSFAETDALGLGREEVLDLLSSRTKTQRSVPLLPPSQCNALAGLIRQILDLKPGAASNLYKVLGQVKAELRTTPAAVPPTPPLPAPRPAEPMLPTTHREKLTPPLMTPPPPAPTDMEEDDPMTEKERDTPPPPAPRLAETTPPFPHGEKTSPHIATPPPPLSCQFIDDRWTEADDILQELNKERDWGLGISESDITEAIIYPEDREPLIRRLSTRRRSLLAGFISAAIERARDADPFVREG